MQAIIDWLATINLPGEIITSIIIVFIVLIISLIIYFKVKHTDPLKRPRGIVHLAELMVSSIDNMVKNNMGTKYHRYGGYFLAVAMYMFFGFTIGLIGLPTPMTNYMVPLSLALITFIMIHVTAIRANKWRYFKRFLDPFAVFLPVNLISMWAPLISLSFRLFGNALAGWSIMTIAYWATESLSTALFGWLIQGGVSSIFVAPLITPWLHMYFDLFSSAVQIYVFIILSMIFISLEDPSPDTTSAKSSGEVNKKERIIVKEN
ncbi:MAG TPA: FoF1 ATP synthase subunit a [Bacilli bacterium]|nr:FoF1 ATP synthase subunit a [Bacilli bacterium]